MRELYGVTHFLNTHYIKDETARVKVSDLYATYKAYCSRHALPALSVEDIEYRVGRRFGTLIISQGFIHKTRYFEGINHKTSSTG